MVMQWSEKNRMVMSRDEMKQEIKRRQMGRTESVRERTAPTLHVSWEIERRQSIEWILTFKTTRFRRQSSS